MSLLHRRLVVMVLAECELKRSLVGCTDDGDLNRLARDSFLLKWLLYTLGRYEAECPEGVRRDGELHCDD